VAAQPDDATVSVGGPHQAEIEAVLENKDVGLIRQLLSLLWRSVHVRHFLVAATVTTHTAIAAPLDAQTRQEGRVPYVSLAAVKMESGISSKESEQPRLSLVRSRPVPSDVTAVAWSPDGRRLATAHTVLPAVTVWDTQSLSVVQELQQGAKGHGRNNIAFSPNGRFLASGLRSINVWNTDTWEQRRFIAPHIKPDVPQAGGIESVVFSPDSASLIAVYETSPSFVVAFKASNGTILWSYEPAGKTGRARVTTQAIISPDGGRLTFGTSEPGPIRGERLSRLLTLDARSGASESSIDVQTWPPTAIAISPNGNWAAVATRTASVRIWNLATKQFARELPESAGVWDLAFTADSAYLIGSKSDVEHRKTLALWAVGSGTLLQQVESWPVALGIALSPDGKYVAAAAGNQLMIYEILKGSRNEVR
jgi:WD40 repeat protein